MAKTRLSFVFGLIIAIFMSLMLVNAVQSFTVSPTSFTQTATIGDSGSGTFTIDNTGNESLNLTLSDTNLIATSDSISLTLNTTSFTDIPAGETRDVLFSYSTSGADVASYDANITVANTQNTSQSEVVTVALTTSSPTGASLDIDNHADDIFEMQGDIDEREKDNIRFRNTGNITLTNLQFAVTDLVGDNDEIENNDIDFEDSGFDLNANQSKSVEIEIDVPSGINEDIYEGTITVTTDEGASFNFGLTIEVTADDIDVTFDFNGADVRDGVLEITGEEGELVDDFEFIIDNDGEIDLFDLRFELDSDLEGEFSSSTIAASRVTFSPTTVDLEEGEDDNIEVRVDIPSGQVTGDYYADLEVLTSAGRKLDEITLKVRVIGDVFIKEINIPETANPGDTVDVEVVVRNQESQLQRNVKVTGILEDVDSANSDITETTSTFILDSREEKTQVLRFKLPEDATDGSKTLEITVDFDGGELIEIEEVEVTRPDHKISIESYSVNPGVVVCEDNLFTLLRIKNLGRFDEDVRVTAEIVGEPIIAETGIFELEEDDVSQRNLVLDVSSLEPGSYIVEQRAIFDGQFVKRESLITVAQCGGSNIDVKPIENSSQNRTVEPGTPITFFGQDLQPSTVYLGTGVAVVVVLIIVALFLL